MAREMVDTRLTTPVVILKTTKTRIRKLAKDIPKKSRTESDDMVIIRLLTEYEINHPTEISLIPKSTYKKKPTS